MTVARAPQLLYTRLEAAHSLRGRSGYQLIAPPGRFSAGLLDAVERRVRCFQPADRSVERLQFAPLPDERFLVARTRVLSGSSPVLDGADRRGIFLAEVAIPGAEAMARVDDDPFAFLAAFELPADAPIVGERLRRGGDGFAPEIAARPDEGTDGLLPRPAAEEALGLVARLLGECTPPRQPIVLALEPDAARRALRLLLQLLPPDLRRSTSFDTAADGCPHAPADWTVLALPTPPSPGTGRSLGPVLPAEDDSTPESGCARAYLRWLRHALGRRPPARIAAQTATAWSLLRRLQRLDATGPGRPDEETCREILRLERPALERHVVHGLAELAGAPLARRLGCCVAGRVAGSAATTVAALLAPGPEGRVRLAELAADCARSGSVPLGPLRRRRLLHHLRRHGARR